MCNLVEDRKSLYSKRLRLISLWIMVAFGNMLFSLCLSLAAREEECCSVLLYRVSLANLD